MYINEGNSSLNLKFYIGVCLIDFTVYQLWHLKLFEKQSCKLTEDSIFKWNVPHISVFTKSNNSIILYLCYSLVNKKNIAYTEIDIPVYGNVGKIIVYNFVLSTVDYTVSSFYLLSKYSQRIKNSTITINAALIVRHETVKKRNKQIIIVSKN